MSERPVIMTTRPTPRIVTPEEWEQVRMEQCEYERKHRPCTKFLWIFKRHIWNIKGSFWTHRRCVNCGKEETQYISHL